MSTWSSRRKFTYGTVFVLVLILIIALPIFIIFYKAPTCTDGKKNGDELGIDCGGSCRKLCQSAFFPPYIVWGGAKFEKVANGLYNLSALIENQNLNGAAMNVPYRMSLFDERGILIVEKEGYVNLFAHRKSMAFESAVYVGKRTPARATFEFTKAPIWFKSHDALGGLSVLDKRYKEDENSSSLEVELRNNTVIPYNNVSVSVVLYDSLGNVIGFSRTQIDTISANSKEIAPFTWPISRKGRVTSIEVIPLIVPPVDR